MSTKWNIVIWIKTVKMLGFYSPPWVLIQLLCSATQGRAHHHVESTQIDHPRCQLRTVAVRPSSRTWAHRAPTNPPKHRTPAPAGSMGRGKRGFYQRYSNRFRVWCPFSRPFTTQHDTATRAQTAHVDPTLNYAPGTYHCWVARSNVESKLGKDFLHIFCTAGIEPQTFCSWVQCLNPWPLLVTSRVTTHYCCRT